MKRKAETLAEPATKRVKPASIGDPGTAAIPIRVKTGLPSNESIDTGIKDTEPVSFLTLPAEIRLRIYDYVFGNTKPICLPVKGGPQKTKSDAQGRPRFHDDKPEWGFQKGVFASMARVNKQISQEVRHFVYSTRSFMLTVPHHRPWITQIGHSNASMITNIILSCRGRAKTAAENLSGTLITLRTRGLERLRCLTLYDNGLSVDSSFLVRQLLQFGESQGWRRFPALQRLSFHLPHPCPPVADTPLYETLCLQSGARVSSSIFRAATAGSDIFRAAIVGRPTPPSERRVEAWLRLDPIALRRRVREEREAKRQAALRRREQRDLVGQEQRRARQAIWLRQRDGALAATPDHVYADGVQPMDVD
ncbi:hypothetical protein BT67DRAFT_495759 [Trichocladium antarcticum]|uniref:Uncharacterized protein n=1 Tax=Trichocladium antarcticum TaxID=1450529 RepID=A0AAN6ULC8_9PEZI|nr:hypothetical protein BT67DRAFT_495759 [Trichocladium antarcticum]